MSKLRDQTYEDLNEFVKRREKLHWRSWDKYKYTNVPLKALLAGGNGKQSIEYLNLQIEQKRSELFRCDNRLSEVIDDCEL